MFSLGRKYLLGTCSDFFAVVHLAASLQMNPNDDNILLLLLHLSTKLLTLGSGLCKCTAGGATAGGALGFSSLHFNAKKSCQELSRAMLISNPHTWNYTSIDFVHVNDNTHTLRIKKTMAHSNSFIIARTHDRKWVLQTDNSVQHIHLHH